MDLRDVAIFMGRCEEALFQAIFGHKTRTLMLIASVSKLAFLYVDTMEKRFLIFPQRERQVLKINQILRNHLPIL
jgi:hypothetical protein